MVFSQSLIVTSDNTLAHDLHDRLRKLGHQVVDIAASREEAMSKIELARPELVLADIGPQGGETKTGQLIQTRYDLPVIYVTRNNMGQATIQRARPTGPIGYVYRPFMTNNCW